MSAQHTKFKKKKRLGSYPFVSVVFSITLALFVIGLFGLLIIHAKNLSEAIQSNMEMQVYLQKNIAENERRQLQAILSEKDYVLKQDNVPQIQFISKEEAAKQYYDDTGEDVVAFLGDNPLRDAYTFKININYQGKEEIQQVKKDVEAISGVFEATYAENLADTINNNLAKISIVLIGFFVFLLLAISILINNTIKLALFSQRFLIRSMQLVGAKSSFIKKPFLSRAILHGLLGGIVASLLLYGLLRYAQQQIEGLSKLQNPDEILFLFGILLFMGAFIGFLSAYKAIQKYLKLSLDELY